MNRTILLEPDSPVLGDINEDNLLSLGADHGAMQVELTAAMPADMGKADIVNYKIKCGRDDFDIVYGKYSTM